jgi:adenine-specific DNA-methyltransferase
MDLFYENKKTRESILNCSRQILDVIPYSSQSILIKSDNFTALSRLIESYSNKIDLIYIDPPFNTRQEFRVSENRSNTISSQADGKIAYCDNMNTEDYLEQIRERLILLYELLSVEGSIYLHIDCKIGHYVKIVMDEIFGIENFKNDITRVKSNPKNFHRRAYGNEKDMILFYAKNAKRNIWNDIRDKMSEEELSKRFKKTDTLGRRYTTIPLHAPGESSVNSPTGKPWRDIPVPSGRHWRTSPIEFEALDIAGLIEWSSSGNPRIKKYADEHQGKKIQDIWTFKDPQKPRYPTQKNDKLLDRIILQSSRENSIIIDCFAGSGTTLLSAERNGRKWIGIDNSVVAIETIRSQVKSPYMYYEFSL